MAPSLIHDVGFILFNIVKLELDVIFVRDGGSKNETGTKSILTFF